MEMEGNKEVYGYDRRVDIIIRRMRKKMEEDKWEKKMIIKIRGGG